MAKPKLRFPEFTDEWEENSLKNLFKISAGGDIDKENSSMEYSEKFPYAVYANSMENKGLYGYANYYKIEGDTLTVTGRGVNIGVAISRHERYVPIVRLLVCEPKNYENVDFFAAVINNSHIFFESTGVPQLTSPQLERMIVKFPSLEEQKKIANFLSYVNDIIQVQEEEILAIEEQKKGVMQKLFNREVRFIADDGSEYPEWEEKFLGDLFDISAGGDIDKAHSADYETEEYCYPVFANALANNGLYGYADYYKVSGDTITVTGRGDVGHAVARHCAYVPIVRLLVLAPIYKENVDFFAYQINLKNIFIESTGVPQLTSPQLKKMKIECPDFEEQQKIADCLLAYEEVIQIKKEKLEIWKKIKKGLLQQMFV